MDQPNNPEDTFLRDVRRLKLFGIGLFVLFAYLVFDAGAKAARTDYMGMVLSLILATFVGTGAWLMFQEILDRYFSRLEAQGRDMVSYVKQEMEQYKLIMDDLTNQIRQMLTPPAPTTEQQQLQEDVQAVAAVLKKSGFGEGKTPTEADLPTLEDAFHKITSRHTRLTLNEQGLHADFSAESFTEAPTAPKTGQSIDGVKRSKKRKESGGESTTTTTESTEV